MPMAFESGPFLIVAALCDKVLREVDGVLSLIRVIDKLTLSVAGPVNPDELPALPVNLSLVIMLRAGEANGSYILKVRPRPPSGPPLGETELPITFTGTPDMGLNLVITFGMTTSQDGIYWIEILLNDEQMTRIPLRVEYSSQTVGSP